MNPFINAMQIFQALN